MPGAGGVVFNPRGEVLLIRDRADNWVFPKGKPEVGEPVPEAARREVFEETGVRAELCGELPATEYLNAQGVRRHVAWFLMRGHGPVLPEEKSAQTWVGFFPVHDALTRLSFTPDLELLEFARQAWERETGRPPGGISGELPAP